MGMYIETGKTRGSNTRAGKAQKQKRVGAKLHVVLGMKICGMNVLE
jgi:hypothetical protein